MTAHPAPKNAATTPPTMTATRSPARGPTVSSDSVAPRVISDALIVTTLTGTA
jgi:hypothetical protein